MKKILVVAVITVLLFGCGKKEDKNENVAQKDSTGVFQTVKDTNPPKQVSLSYTLAKNDHYRYRLTTISNSTKTIKSDTTINQNIKQKTTYVFEMEVVDVDTDSIMDIKAQINSVNLEADANGQKFTYNSEANLDSSERKQYMEYEAILKIPFYFRLNPKGEITEIYRVDKILNKFLELQNLEDSVTADMKKQLQYNITEGALKPLLVQMFRILPTNPVAKDSVWTNKYTSQLAVFQIFNTAKYKIIDFEKSNDSKYAVIDAGLDIVAKGKNKVSEKGINYDFKTPEADANGKIYFNLAKGLIEKSKTTTKLKLTMAMSMPKGPKGPQNATSLDYIESTNIVELF